jgi:hypothetical protein
MEQHGGRVAEEFLGKFTLVGRHHHDQKVHTSFFVLGALFLFLVTLRTAF